jgi:uncharacterized protein (TIGR03790 family)
MRFASFGALLLLATPLLGLEPREIVILVNKNSAGSREVAEHYKQKRGVPAGNVVVLDTPLGEDISRSDYEEKIAKPLRKELANRRDRVKVLLTTYGVPLRVGPLDMSEQEKKDIAEVRKELQTVNNELKSLQTLVSDLEEDAKRLDIPQLKDRADKKRLEIPPIEAKARELDVKERRLRHAESEASVDSELMQLWWDEYPKDRWVMNPLYFRNSPAVRRTAPQTLMTARLDGPSSTLAKRLVDDAIAAEEKGLDGIAYIDARGIKYDPQADPTGTAYGGYDESFRELAALLKDKGKMDVVLDDADAIFPRDSCPNCAIYCGWYSVNHYVPCCKFNQGAVAWHLASLEAISLRNPKTQWAGNLLKAGAAATLGPVAEPYTLGFPKPAEFFGLLGTGRYTLVESYAQSVMVSSWMMTLVGDPLYNPFKKAPLLKLSDVKPSPQVTPPAVP